MEVYFDNATIINGEEAVINIHASFCGLEIYVPKEWEIINQAHVSFGAIEEKTKNRNIVNKEKTVILTGEASFCGVEIIYI